MSDSASRIAAALAIHAPCHTEDTERHGCTHGTYSEAGAFSSDGEEANCVSCTHDDRTVTYPCPTATALGVATNEGSSK